MQLALASLAHVCVCVYVSLPSSSATDIQPFDGCESSTGDRHTYSLPIIKSETLFMGTDAFCVSDYLRDFTAAIRARRSHSLILPFGCHELAAKFLHSSLTYENAKQEAKSNRSSEKMKKLRRSSTLSRSDDVFCVSCELFFAFVAFVFIHFFSEKSKRHICLWMRWNKIFIMYYLREETWLSVEWMPICVNGREIYVQTYGTE